MPTALCLPAIKNKKYNNTATNNEQIKRNTQHIKHRQRLKKIDSKWSDTLLEHTFLREAYCFIRWIEFLRNIWQTSA